MGKHILPRPHVGDTREIVLSPNAVESAFRYLGEALAQDDRVLFAYAHGSFLSRLPSHDLDVAVYFRYQVSPKDRLDACLDLEGKAERALGVPVDVHAIDPGNLAFSFDALSGRLLFSRDENERERFEEKTIALFMDFKPLLKQILKDLAED